MAKKKRKHVHNKVVSRNALSSNEPKKRFGKKQKRKVIIIVFIVLLVFLAINYFVKDYRAKKAMEEEAARKGKIIERMAEKKELDEKGNEIVSYKDAEMHILNVGNGNTVLLKKGDFEVLVDAGNKNIIKYLKKHIDGNLEYFITTNGLDQNLKGYDAVMDAFEVDNYIYNNSKSDIGEPADGQIIDLDENCRVTVTPGEGESDYDKTAVVTFSDRGFKMLIVGPTTENNVLSLSDNRDISVYVAGGELNLQNTPARVMNKISPQCFIASTKQKLSADFVKEISSIGISIYATYKSGIITIQNSEYGATFSVDYEDQIIFD